MTVRMSSANSTAQEIASHAPYPIEIVVCGGLTPTQQDAFENAAKRWSAVIADTLPLARVQKARIRGVKIFAKGASIDGAGSVLGQAGPRFLRPGSRLPIIGDMEFDMADLWNMEQDGTLDDVIAHEMGHVLGIGTIWDDLDLLKGAGGPNPRFVGERACAEFQSLSKLARPVPVENTGGPGTRDGHWRESVFGNELMTGFIADEGNPLSRLTIACLEDMGYSVNYEAADPYELPTHLKLAVMGVGAERPHAYQCSACAGRRRHAAEVLPAASLVG